MINNTLISIDPSIRVLGVSVWRDNKLYSAYTLRTTGKYLTWQDRALTMACRVGSIIVNHQPSIVVIEIHENWHSQRGNVSKDSESIQKLYYYVGLQAGLLPYIYGQDGSVTVLGITPNTWKGNVPKNVMLTRCNKVVKQQKLNWDIKDHNVAEAILLGNKSIKLLGDSIVHSIPILEDKSYVVLFSIWSHRMLPTSRVSTKTYNS